MAVRGGTYGDGGVDALHVALLDEDLHGLEAERLDLRLREGLAPLQLLDLPVQIRRPHLRLSRRRGSVPSFLSPPSFQKLPEAPPRWRATRPMLLEDSRVRKRREEEGSACGPGASMGEAGFGRL
jgi:hypothetical protein